MSVTAKTPAQRITVAGVLISLDETLEFPALTVTVPANLRNLPKAFIEACHLLAGNAGASIEFKREA